MLDRSTKIFIAGHCGLVGSAVTRCFKNNGFDQLLLRSHADLDLTDQQATREYFSIYEPEIVILAAAKVGGIKANNSFPAEFIYTNLAIQTNVINEAFRFGVQRLFFLGSSCIYPRDCPQPIREEYLLTGPLEPTNEPYAVAKIAGIETCWGGTDFIPRNIWGVKIMADLIPRKFCGEKIMTSETIFGP